MLALTDDTLAEIVKRVQSGMGVEAALAELNIDSNIGMAWLKAHPTARADLAAAKAQ